jgi:polyisoprenoid-binding protein YceI
MFKRVLVTGLLVAFVLPFVVACGLLQEPEEASGPIEAIPLEVTAEEQQPTATAQPEDTRAVEEYPEPQVELTEETLDPYPEGAEATDEPAEIEVTDEPAEPTGGGLVIFTISPENSQVRFEIDEELRGQPNLVVGTTDQVAGQIAVDRSDLSATQVGIIQVNARTLVTDNDFRNRAINNEILNTDEHEFITFTPTAINGLPDSVDIGETVNFTIVGDLTIRDITNEATFNVEATLVSDTELVGTASTIVSRTDYNLIIPSVPNVANVEEEVELYIDFMSNST